jgi:xylulokinase
MSLIGLDIGTTGCKAAAFDESGKMLSSHYEEYPLYIPEADQCELDPQEIWKAVERVIRGTALDVKSSDPVMAIGISTLGDSVTPLDKNGNPIYRTVVGAADRRAVSQTAWIEQHIGREDLFKLTGAPLHAYCTVPKIMWFRDNRPDVFRHAAKFGGWQEIIHTKLGLEPYMDYSLAGRTMLVNILTRDWAFDLFDICGIDPGLFSTLAGSNSVVGEIDSAHAEPLGLGPGVRVVTGGFDQCCCAMGAGVMESGMAALTLGTLEGITAVYDTCRLEKSLLEGNHGCGFHIADGFYFSLGYVTTSGAVLRWYRDTLGSVEVLEAEKHKQDPYDIMVNSTPDKPANVFILPYFSGTGTPWLDLKQKGSVFGLSLDTDRSEIIKGILDGICYEVKLNIESMESAGIIINRFRSVGGGAKSERWMQLKADITDVPVETTWITEAGCLGAAFLAGLGTGVYKSPEDINNIVSVNKVFEPRNSFKKQYEEKYLCYQDLRERVKGLEIKISK